MRACEKFCCAWQYGVAREPQRIAYPDDMSRVSFARALSCLRSRRIFSQALIAFALLAAALTSVAAAADKTQPLGRLFMAPEWRSHLERQRQFNIQETRSVEGGSLRLDGVVVRSANKSTVWVNNQPHASGDSASGIAAAVSRQQPDRARIATGSEPAADMKVGTTLDRTTRETSGGLAGGEIRVNRK